MKRYLYVMASVGLLSTVALLAVLWLEKGMKLDRSQLALAAGLLREREVALASVPGGPEITPPSSPADGLLVRRGDGELTDVVSIDIDAASNWHMECVDCPKRFGNETSHSLQLDGNGHPHIAYGEDHLYHAWHDGTKWHYEIADAASGVGKYASLVLDGSGRPHISYYDSVNKDLKYAWHDGTGWQVQTVHSEGRAGECTSLALDGLGRPRISYCDSAQAYLRYAWHYGAGWQVQMVDNVSTLYGCYPASLALDGLGRPHMSYRGGLDLKYAWHDGVTWHVEIAARDEGFFPSLALDELDRPHISYYDTRNGDVKYAQCDGAAWQIETVDSEGHVGWFTSLALDEVGCPHINYIHVGDYSDRWLK